MLIPARQNNTQRFERTLSEPAPDQKFNILPEFDQLEYKGNPLNNSSSSPVTDMAGEVFDKAEEETDVVDMRERVIENEMVSEMEPSSSDSGTVARCTSVKPLKIRFCRPSGSLKKSSKAKRQVSMFN